MATIRKIFYLVPVLATLLLGAQTAFAAPFFSGYGINGLVSFDLSTTTGGYAGGYTRLDATSPSFFMGSPYQTIYLYGGATSSPCATTGDFLGGGGYGNPFSILQANDPAAETNYTFNFLGAYPSGTTCLDSIYLTWNGSYYEAGIYVPPPTSITAVSPPDIASSTSASPLPYTFSMTMFLNPTDFTNGSTTIDYSLINRDYGGVLTGSFVATTSGTQTFSGTVNTSNQNGFYQGVWSVHLPITCGNGLTGGCFSSTLSTSTSFVLGYSSIKTINQEFENATTTVSDCSQYTSLTDPNYYLCPVVTKTLAGLRWLFMPDSASIESVFSLFDTIQAKAPAGYFFQLKNAINGITASGTPAITYEIPTDIQTNLFSPIRTALEWILWFFFAFNFYKILKITRII